MALHNAGDFVAVVVDSSVVPPCALVADDDRQDDYAARCRAAPARPGTAADNEGRAVGWLVADQRCFADPQPGRVLADAQVTGTFVHRMPEPKGWRYGDEVWWAGGLSTERGGVFVGWLLECKFGFARVQIDVTGVVPGI